MPKRLGSLTTRGRCLLAVGFAAALSAVLIDERDLLRVAAFIIAAPLLASVLVGRTQLRLRADRELVPSRISVGGECQVRLTLQVTGRCNGRLLVEDVVPQELGGPRRTVVARLTQHREVQLSYQLRPPERKVHSLGPLNARVTDPLGLAEYRRTLAEHSRLVVLPAVVPLTGWPTRGEVGAGPSGGGPVGGGPGQDAAVVRSYRHGDDLRRVHWPTSARRDELMVRVEEWSERSGVTVLLDNRATAHRGAGPASSLEYAVSFAASVYVHLRQRTPRVRLVTTDGVVRAGANDGATYATDAALEALAALRAAQARDLTSGPDPASRQEVIAILGAVGPAAVEHLLANHLRAARGHAVLLNVAAWGTKVDDKIAPHPVKAARLLIAAGWSVAIVNPEHSPSSVWEQMCIGSQRPRGASTQGVSR